MAPSYRSINYSLRPGKHAERKMLSEALRKLTPFGSVESYRYIGMGSLWFSDFSHFHKSLGIDSMISIEREASHKDRFEFNKPFGSIELRFRSTTVELPLVDWSVRSIVWLDYDDRLTQSMINDASIIAQRAQSGSVIIMSVQVEGPPTTIEKDEDGEDKNVELTSIEMLRNAFGQGAVPADAEDTDLRGWAMAKLARQMIKQSIQNALAIRNASRPVNQHVHFKQFVAFDYADGAKMTTVGGVFCDAGQNELFLGCGFHNLKFYQCDDQATKLTVPVLTQREMKYLEARLPVAPNTELNHGSIPKSDAAGYAELYRYLPNFSALDN